MVTAATHRVEQVADEYKRHLSALLLTDIEDPAIKGLTITQIIFTPDLKLAKVYYYVSEADESLRNDILKGFLRCKGFIKREMARRVLLKYQPDLRFYYDDSFDEKHHIDQLFDQIQGESHGDSQTDHSDDTSEEDF